MEAPQNSTPEIDYLAKDFESFRGLLLDHLHLHLPRWTERHQADLCVTLVELLAYVGDSLSYYQDAVAAEAYLATARQRISVRRHARLLNYSMSQGCNARVLVQFQTAFDGVEVPAHTRLLTRILNEEVVIAPSRLSRAGSGGEPAVFETMHAVTLYRSGNGMAVETGGGAEFSMRRGATAAQLTGRWPHLAAGDLLIFQAVGPSDAALPKPHPVRLSGAPTVETSPEGRSVTTVRWFAEDALPEDFVPPGSQAGENRCIVLGNVVLADSGVTVQEWLAPPQQGYTYAPRLAQRGLLHAAPVDADELLRTPAARSLVQPEESVLPSISIEEVHRGPNDSVEPLPVRRWTVRRHLLDASRFEPSFAVEIDNDSHAILRFPVPGTGQNGGEGSLASHRPRYALRATYRVHDVGNDHIAPGTIQHAVGEGLRLTGVTNPLAACGQRPAETLEHVRQNAPQSFRQWRRCVTAEDYARRAGTFPDVGTARAQRRGTSVQIEIDRGTSLLPDQTLLTEVAAFVAPWTLLGDVVEIGLAAVPDTAHDSQPDPGPAPGNQPGPAQAEPNA